MKDKNVKWYGFAGGLCFLLAILISGYISVLGIAIGIYMVSQGAKAKKLGMGVIIMNAIVFLIGLLFMFL